MRVLVCGDRNWTDGKMIYDELDFLHDIYPDVEIISGMARGVDTFAARWAKTQLVKLHPFEAQWEEYGGSAGPIRNNKMLKEGRPNLVLAFHDDIENSKGTKNMVTIARRAGVETRVISHEGE